MNGMAKEERKQDRHKKKPLQLRLHPLMKRQLKELAVRNTSTMTAEIVVAIRELLKKEGLWPPKEE